MTYSEALTYLGEARRFGVKLGLDPMRHMAVALGDPQTNLPFIHIAGTNGKGSTAAFCESCLRAAGYRVGLYTSPHLVSIRERIQVNREPISTEDFAEGIAAIQQAQTNVDPPATFFEIMTALALGHFAREKVDWVVWETGLGGRFDATNIVSPVVSVITNIGLDHQQFLGQTLEEIAREKAGIIKPAIPVISTVEPGPALEVIRQQAESGNSPLISVFPEMEVEDLGLRGLKQIARFNHHELSLGLIGPHQIANAACAMTVMNHLKISTEAIHAGLENTVWSGRFEILSEKPFIVLDGAHNPAGVRMLVQTWQECLRVRLGWSAEEAQGRTHLIFASVADKDITEMAQCLKPLAQKVSIVRLANERTAEPVQLAAHFADLHVELVDRVTDLWQSLQNANPDVPILIAGSLFLAGEMLAQRQGTTEEYRLNERFESFTATR